MSKDHKYNSLVIGGGIAGISAALRLSAKGKKVLLVEASGRLGGRAGSVSDKKSGELLDTGQHVMTGAYKDFFKLLDFLGIRDKARPQDALRVEFRQPGRSGYVLDTSFLPGKAGMIGGMIKMKGLSISSKLRAISLLAKLNSTVSFTEGLTVLEFLSKEKQTPEMIHKFWEPLVLATLNSSLDKVAASLFITVMKEAFFSDKDNARLYFAALDMGSFFDRTGSILEDKGGKLLLEKKASEIIIDKGLAAGVKLSSGEVYYAESVISALPPFMLKNLIPDIFSEKFNYLEKFIYSPIISIYLWYGRDPELPIFTALTGTKVHWVFNRRAILEKSEVVYPGSLSLTISAADKMAAMPAKQIIDIALKELSGLFHELNGYKPVHWKISRENKATVLLTPESLKLRPLPVTAIPGLYLAGDWTDTGLPATIESAAKSGRLAAEAVENYID